MERYHPKDPCIHQGVYIDIFPCDILSDSPVMRRLQFAASKAVIAKALYARGYETDSVAKKYTKKRKKNRRHKNNINILFSLSIYILQINKSHKKLKEVRKIKEEEIINKINKIMHELEDVDFMEINKRKYNQAQVNEAYIMLDELKRELEGTYE